MAAFDQVRFLHLKKYLHCTLLILKRINFVNKKEKGYAGFGKSERSFTDAFEYRCS